MSIIEAMKEEGKKICINIYKDEVCNIGAGS